MMKKKIICLMAVLAVSTILTACKGLNRMKEDMDVEHQQ